MRPSSPLIKAMCHLRWLFAVRCFLNSSASAQSRIQPPARNESRRWGVVMLTLCFLGSFVAGTAVGQTLWEENGHYYLIVEQETTWQQARLLAESMVFMGVQGHLATITSEAENTFVTTQLSDTAGAWLGGAQPLGSEEPAGGWRWITGELWVYTNWDEGEPSNTYLGGWGKDATGQSDRVFKNFVMREELGVQSGDEPPTTIPNRSHGP
jgi:hypothetical protein